MFFDVASSAVVTSIIQLIIPAVSALAGVGTTLVGTSIIEGKKWARLRQAERDKDARDVLTDFLEATTNVAWVLRRVAEAVVARRQVERDEVANQIHESVGMARRCGTVLELVAPVEMCELTNQMDTEFTKAYFAFSDEENMLDAAEKILESYETILQIHRELIEQFRRRQKELA